MTFDELMVARKITPQEAQIYQLFNMSDEGRAWYLRMFNDTFMDCVPPPEFSNAIAFYAEGRRSIIRDIKVTIDRINHLLTTEDVYD